MKVSGHQPPKTNELSTGKTQPAVPRSPQVRKPETGDAEHVAGRTSLTMNRIRDVVRETADIRADRVAELRARIRSGDYQVDADRLAAKMLQEEGE